MTHRSQLSPTRLLACVCLSAVIVALAGCGSAAHPGTRLDVVAGENFWGSLAAQLAGTRATVHSIIVNPQTDPHSYEPSADDARAVAGASLVVVNGIGYDEWLSHLVAADGSSGQLTLDVGDLLGLHDGDNPHQWYSPVNVTRVVHAITADLQRLDPHDRAYFAARERTLLGPGLRTYHDLIAQIRARYAGVPVGYSESIFQPLGEALGLRLMTPYSFAKAIAEGTDVTATDKETVDAQATRRQIEVWVFNSQNVTPDVAQVNTLARSHGIPIATVTETLSPARDSFQQWQVAELRALAAALHRATGR
jgi:zinc/manganese transport system substrate-binding protein